MGDPHGEHSSAASLNPMKPRRLCNRAPDRAPAAIRATPLDKRSYQCSVDGVAL